MTRQAKQPPYRHRVAACPRRSCSRKSPGQALVELALLLPILTILGFAAVDLAGAYANKNTAADAAEQAARQLSKDSTVNVTTAAQSQDSASWTRNTCTAVASSPLPATGSGGQISVTVTCHYAPLTPLLKNIIGTPTVTVIAYARSDY